MSDPRNYLPISCPDKAATIDFFSYTAEDGRKVEESTVKITREYDPKTGKATLHIYATTGTFATILLDQSFETETNDPEEDADEDEDDS